MGQMVLSKKWILAVGILFSSYVIAEEVRFSDLAGNNLVMVLSDNTCSLKVLSNDVESSGICSLDLSEERIYIVNTNIYFNVSTKPFADEEHKFYQDENGTIVIKLKPIQIDGMLINDAYLIKSKRFEPWESEFQVIFSVKHGLVSFQKKSNGFDSVWLRNT
jgi:hypothetical protein